MFLSSVSSSTCLPVRGGPREGDRSAVLPTGAVVSSALASTTQHVLPQHLLGDSALFWNELGTDLTLAELAASQSGRVRGNQEENSMVIVRETKTTP